MTIADGSRLLVGDDSTGTNDIVANTLVATAGGADVFRFSTAPNTCSNADVVSDFNPVADGNELENAVFTALAATGALAAAHFVASNTGAATGAKPPGPWPPNTEQTPRFCATRV